MYDSCSEDIEVRVGYYVIANISDFGLEKGKIKYFNKCVDLYF
ncbi:hypothetical protein [Clostridioides difficile]|nr:hypothetical protein [Clostridioides difficile]